MCIQLRQSVQRWTKLLVRFGHAREGLVRWSGQASAGLVRSNQADQFGWSGYIPCWSTDPDQDWSKVRLALLLARIHGQALDDHAWSRLAFLMAGLARIVLPVLVTTLSLIKICCESRQLNVFFVILNVRWNGHFISNEFLRNHPLREGLKQSVQRLAKLASLASRY